MLKISSKFIRQVVLLLAPLTLRTAGAVESAVSNQPPAPPVALSALADGQTVSNLSGAADSARYFTIVVPTGQVSLAVGMGGGAGDADLYLRHGEPPTVREYDCRPFVLGNAEEINVDEPAVGVWHLMVRGYAGYTGAWITATLTAAQPPAAGDPAEPYRDMELALYYELYGFAARNEIWTAELKAQALRQEGWNAFNAGDFTNAINAWNKWQVLEPENADPLSLVGDVYLHTGAIDQAMEDYRRSLEIYPGQIELAMRCARLMDTTAAQSGPARDLLNFYARIFPNNPTVTLAQAAWLVRRRRYDEARALARQVIAASPDESAADKLHALTLLHGLLPSMRERFENLHAMLAIADRPGMAAALAASIREYDLLIYPESWMLLNFIAQAAAKAGTPEQRQYFTGLLPRRTLAVEEFRYGRMSSDWAASKDENLLQDGRLILNTAVNQSEVALRLVRSEAMPNGFIETLIENSRGFFWIYARRGAGNMTRFGFSEDGRIYLQLWINGQLLANHNRVWYRQPGMARLRLELRGDGAFGYVDGALAFNAPLAIPQDMGLGWWGFAPWSQQPGAAGAIVRQLQGGPLPVQIGILDAGADDLPADTIQRLKSRMRALSALAPPWFCQQADGAIAEPKPQAHMDLRLLCRYYRVRLLPSVAVSDPHRLDFGRLIELAHTNRFDGLTLLVTKMPDPAWLAAAEESLLNTSLTIMVMLLDENQPSALVREICAHVGLFPTPRRTATLPVIAAPALPPAAENSPTDPTAPSAVLTL